MIVNNDDDDTTCAEVDNNEDIELFRQIFDEQFKIDKFVGISKNFRIDTMDEKTLDKMMTIVNSCEFRKTIAFLDHDNGSSIFEFPVKQQQQQQQQRQQHSNEQINDVDLQNLLAIDEQCECEILSRLTGINVAFRKSNSFTKSELKSLIHYEMNNDKCKRRKNFDFKKKFHNGHNSYWYQWKQRFRIYNFYLIKKMFDSVNCVMICWMLCFCTSMLR